MVECIPILEVKECSWGGLSCKCVPNTELIIILFIGFIALILIAYAISEAAKASARSASNLDTKQGDRTFRKIIAVSPKYKEDVLKLAKDIFASSGWRITNFSTSTLVFERGDSWYAEDFSRVATLTVGELGKKLTLNLHLKRPDKWYTRGRTFKQNELLEIERNFDKLIIESNELVRSKKAV